MRLDTFKCVRDTSCHTHTGGQRRVYVSEGDWMCESFNANIIYCLTQINLDEGDIGGEQNKKQNGCHKTKEKCL